MSPGEVAVAVPNQIIVVDRLEEPERRLWADTHKIPTDYIELLLRAQRRDKERPGESEPQVREEREQRTAEKVRDAYERSGVPSESLPSADGLKQQLEEAHLQAEQSQGIKAVPEEIRLSWVLFEDGLFYGPKRTAYCLLLLWTFGRKFQSAALTMPGIDTCQDESAAE